MAQAAVGQLFTEAGGCREMHFSEPLTRQDAMGGAQSRIRFALGVLEKQPAEFLVRIPHISMEGERRHRKTRQDLLVNHPLDTTRHVSRSLRDDGRAVRPDAAESVNGGFLAALQDLDSARLYIVRSYLPPGLELVFLQAFGQDRGRDDT